MNQHHPTSITLAAYADRELDQERSAEIEGHLSHCELCQDELAQLQSLSLAMQDFNLPEGLGEQTWDRVSLRLSGSVSSAQSSQTGLLRWLPPMFLVGASVVLQAVFGIAAVVWALGGLGLVDVRAAVAVLLPPGPQFLDPALEELPASVFSWLVPAPFAPGLQGLMQVIGMDVTDLLSWLVPIVLGMLAFVVLALLYLSWLTAYWKLRRHNQQAALPVG